MKERLLQRLRELQIEERTGTLKKASDQPVLEEWKRSGVKFAASSGRLEKVYYLALSKLLDCIVPTLEAGPVLHEGGIYLGCWLESTGTINTEMLSRYVPSVARSTYELFADYQREDGLMPYKLTQEGPAFRQIQMVTPLARSVWNHYLLHGKDEPFLRKMYSAMKRQDAWLARYRNTRGTGCVEAFSTFDTGHDLSPRFWHVPDTPYWNDPTRYHPDSPLLPFLAPDLTANVYCQRLYLNRMAAVLGEREENWQRLAEQSLESLIRHCYDAEDEFFYDVDRNGEWVRVQSDVLLRVLACEVADRSFFDRALKRYLLNTRKFFAKYPFTSLAMDDPRFDPSSSYNTWGGTTNFLSLIRTPHAFEHHDRHVELTWIMQPIMNAAANMTRFPQALSPWTGQEGFTQTYSPAILCVLDFVERLCGILPTPDGQLWFTGLIPWDMDHGDEIAHELAYSRSVDGRRYELVNTQDRAEVYRDSKLHLVFPSGVRAVTDREGKLQRLIGMTIRRVEGTLWYEGREIPFGVSGNEQLDYCEGQWTTVLDIGVVTPAYR